MANFYASKEWAILVPPDVPEVQKAAGDLSRYIGLLAGSAEGLVKKPPVLMDANGPAPAAQVSVITLNSEGGLPQRNGFSWRTSPDRIEIHGESGRGLCNGIYSFLSSLGINWPALGQETLPSPQVANLRVYHILTAFREGNDDDRVFQPSGYNESSPVSISWRRFAIASAKELRAICKQSESFVAWAARRRYDALILPLAAFASRWMARKIGELKAIAAEYGIAIEAGGRELSALVPRRFFMFHRDYFRMEEGRRKKDHHFCASNPSVIEIIAKEGAKLFRAAGEARVFHLWPDKTAKTSPSAWCACPACRAFTAAEQNRISVNAAASALQTVNPEAHITFFEKPGEGNNVPLRPNLFKLEKLPDEKESN